MIELTVNTPSIPPAFSLDKNKSKLTIFLFYLGFFGTLLALMRSITFDSELMQFLIFSPLIALFVISLLIVLGCLLKNTGEINASELNEMTNIIRENNELLDFLRNIEKEERAPIVEDLYIIKEYIKTKADNKTKSALKNELEEMLSKRL